MILHAWYDPNLPINKLTVAITSDAEQKVVDYITELQRPTCAVEKTFWLKCCLGTAQTWEGVVHAS